MKTELEVDLKKKTAYLELDYFSMTVDDESKKGLIVSSLSQIEDLVVTVSGNKVSVAIKYDFGVHIPKEIWNMPNNSFIEGFNDRGLAYEWEKICKETILEYVKKILPAVLKSIRSKANEIVSEYN